MRALSLLPVGVFNRAADGEGGERRKEAKRQPAFITPKSYCMLGHAALVPVWQTPSGAVPQEQFTGRKTSGGVAEKWRRSSSSSSSSSSRPEPAPIASTPSSSSGNGREEEVEKGEKGKQDGCAEDDEQEERVGLAQLGEAEETAESGAGGNGRRKTASKVLRRARKRSKNLIRAERQRVFLVAQALASRTSQGQGSPIRSRKRRILRRLARKRRARTSGRRSRSATAGAENRRRLKAVREKR